MSILQPTPDPATGRIEWKGSTVWGPAPAVMVSCGPLASPDIVTVSWTGLACTRPPMTYISLRPERFSHGLVRQAGEQYARTGGIEPSLLAEIGSPMIPEEQYAAIVNAGA